MVRWARSARSFRWSAQRAVATSGRGVGSVLALVTGCLGLLERRRLMLARTIFERCLKRSRVTAAGASAGVDPAWRPSRGGPRRRTSSSSWARRRAGPPPGSLSSTPFPDYISCFSRGGRCLWLDGPRPRRHDRLGDGGGSGKHGGHHRRTESCRCRGDFIPDHEVRVHEPVVHGFLELRGDDQRHLLALQREHGQQCPRRHHAEHRV